AAATAEPPPARAPARVATETARPRVRRLDTQFVALAECVVAKLAPDRSSAVAIAGLDGVPPASVVAPLALAIVARVTGNVVAVDANFRQPTLAERLDARCAKHERTLVDVLRTGSGWRNLVRPTRIARLGVVPGGRISRTSARPVGQSRLEPLLDELRCQYSLILVDLGSLREPHAVEATRYCDGTLFLATLGHTGRREAREAVRAIQRAGGTVWGAIVVDPR
ncbi:MAG: hypothetical protein NUV77_21210, partial [Thermoguttaceae bacterium]|nr:hypothetical protein [Thermoguttaceae bacterium]